VPELGRHVSFDVGIDNFPSARVYLLQLEVLVGAGRNGLKLLGFGSHHIREKVAPDEINHRPAEIGDGESRLKFLNRLNGMRK
jgi:hypothetical protein